MLMWLTISLRNIIKNGRRSLTTILAIALGYAAINLFHGYVHNTYQALTDAAIHGESLGHLTIFKKGYLRQGKLHPEKFQFSRQEAEGISALVKKRPDVEIVTPRLSVSGIISNGKNSTIFISQGMVPDDDKAIRGDMTKSNSFKGDYLADKTGSGVVIGLELAEMLNLNIGSDAVILSNTYSGMANALDAKVVGIFNTGNTATNDKMVLMHYRQAQDLVDFPGAERMIVLLKPGQNGTAADVAVEVSKTLSDAGYNVEVKTWSELSVFYNQVKNLFDMIFLFIFCIVLVIVVMSVINTMGVSVLERTREIGTMRALGLKQSGVKFLFASEGMLLGVLGSVLGGLIFFAVYFIIIIIDPMYLPPSTSNPIPLHVDVVWSALIWSIFFMEFLSFSAAFVPARRSAKMTIVDSLGHI